MPRMRGAEALVKTLEKAGVKYIFGLPGHGNMNILDAIYDSTQIKFMLVRHEQAAAHIADGYELPLRRFTSFIARVSSEVGVCCTSVGPGAANLIMGIAAAGSTSSPLLTISGGIIAKWTGRGQLQETSRAETPTDQCYTQVLQPLVKKVWNITEPTLIPDITRRALAIAQADRPGPVAIEIPWSLQAEFHDIEIPDPNDYAYGRRVRADAESVKIAVDKLRNAQFPVIVAGNGAMISGAESEIIQLAELLGAPVATSFVAKGIIPEDHPLSIGMVGWLGHPVAHEIIREHADCVLVVRFRFSDESTSWWTEGKPFVKENKFIQIDIQQYELAKVYPVEVGLLGDAKATLQEINTLIQSQGGRADADKTKSAVKTIKDNFHLELPPMEQKPMEPLRIANELRNVLPRDSILAVDTGMHAHYFAAFYPIYGPKLLQNPGGWTPMGWGPTAIIGAKLARPDADCVCVTGDGGFTMVCQEVLTAVEWNTPVVWIVFNDKALNAIRHGQRGAYDGRIIGTEFTTRADFAAMARAFGAEGITVEKHADIKKAVKHALNCGKPCVIDMITVSDPIPPPTAGDWCEPVRAWVEPKKRRKGKEEKGKEKTEK